MAQEKPNRLVEWLHLLRQNYPAARQHLADWVSACREQPRLIWETAAVRYATYGVCGLLGAWIMTTLVGLLVPPPPPTAKPTATTADYHVICANSACGHTFVINRKFGFRGFPVECPACKQETGIAGRKCFSDTCRGGWVAPAVDDSGSRCPICGKRFD